MASAVSRWVDTGQGVNTAQTQGRPSVRAGKPLPPEGTMGGLRGVASEEPWRTAGAQLGGGAGRNAGGTPGGARLVQSLP